MRKCPLCRQVYDPTPYRDPNRQYSDDEENEEQIQLRTLIQLLREDNASLDANLISYFRYHPGLQRLNNNQNNVPEREFIFWEQFCGNMEMIWKPFAFWFLTVAFTSIICLLQFWLIIQSTHENTFMKWWVPQVYISLLLFFFCIGRIRAQQNSQHFASLFCLWFIIVPFVPLMFPIGRITKFLDYQ
eukprot:UN30408